MNLFVDANIFLDFYHFLNDDLEELRKLVDLIQKGEIRDKLLKAMRKE